MLLEPLVARNGVDMGIGGNWGVALVYLVGGRGGPLTSEENVGVPEHRGCDVLGPVEVPETLGGDGFSEKGTSGGTQKFRVKTVVEEVLRRVEG